MEQNQQTHTRTNVAVCNSLCLQRRRKRPKNSEKTRFNAPQRKSFPVQCLESTTGWPRGVHARNPAVCGNPPYRFRRGRPAPRCAAGPPRPALFCLATAVPGGLTPSPQNFDQKLKNVSNCSRTALERFDMPECTAMETV